MDNPIRCLGLDVARGHWVGVVLKNSAYESVVFERDIQTVVQAATAAGRLQAIAIDIPIGLPDNDVRQADELVAQQLGRRRSSLFMTPVGAALRIAGYAEAVDLQRTRTGKGFSRQAFGLRTKILEVADWLDGNPSAIVREVHPELSFAIMNGAPLPTGKKSWAGLHERRDLLVQKGITVPNDLGPAGSVAPDDVLDAAAAAWTAHRIATDQARSVPDPPQTFSDGWPAAIWY